MDVNGFFKNKGLARVAAVLALAGILLAVVGIVGVYLTTFPGVEIRRVGFDTALYDSPPRTVSGLLFIPHEPVRTPTPAVVFSHGATVSKEIYVSHCRHLAQQGLVALAIDLRGHGATGGSNDFGLNEMRDVWAAADYLAGLDMVDPERIGAAGHSLGGITSTRAGIFQGKDRLKAVTAIFCWFGQEHAIECFFGPVEDFIGRLWPFMSWSRRYDLNDEEDLTDRDVLRYVTRSKPPNYQLVIGKQDQFGTVEQAEQFMEKATGRAEVEPGETYGDFATGTARRLEVTGEDHLMEAASTEVLNAVIGWFFEAFDLPAPEPVNNTAVYRYLGWSLILCGLLLVSAASVFGLRARKAEPEPPGDIAPYRPDGRSAGVWLGSVAGLLFAGVSLAAFPFARMTGIRAFVPFAGADVFTSLVLSRTILLLPCALLLYVCTRVPGWNRLDPLGGGEPQPKNLLFSVLLGALPVTIFVALYAPTAHGLLLTRGVPASAWGFFAVAAVLTFQLMAEQEYLHYFFMPAFPAGNTTGKRLVYILSEAFLRGVALGIAFIPVAANPFQSVGRSGVLGRTILLPALIIGGFFLFLPVSALAYYARRRGYNVLAPCLAVALFVALFFGTIISVRAF